MRYCHDQQRFRLRSRECIYCGEVGDNDEHFPPVTWGPDKPGFIFTACGECNRLAGTTYPVDFLRRAEWVRRKLAKRYKLALRFPGWDEDDIAALGPNIQREVRAWIALRDTTRRRLAWSALALLCSIVRTSGSARIAAKIGTTPQNAPGWWLLLSASLEASGLDFE